MLNLFLVVIATQFSETKKRETELILAERRRFHRSSSSVFSNINVSCWEASIRYIRHLYRKAKRTLSSKFKDEKKKPVNKFNSKVCLKFQIINFNSF